MHSRYRRCRTTGITTVLYSLKYSIHETREQIQVGVFRRVRPKVDTVGEMFKEQEQQNVRHG